METNSFDRPVWQLIVCESDNYGGAFVPKAAKYHCFTDNVSLCGRYAQDTAAYDDGITVISGAILHDPTIACKRCRDRWLGKFHLKEEATPAHETHG